MSVSHRSLILLTLAAIPALAQTPTQVPPKRSSQIRSGFGINSDLPREPYLPWNRWWWTRMFDAGVSWIRIGQYENSSEPTSWDWVKVQVQLLYGNPMYTSPSGHRPDQITPKPGSFHNDDRSIDSVFWAPKTPEQIEAFLRYVKWMVNHFKGRIHYYALWNEQDIGYWNYANPEDYGRLLAAFAPALQLVGDSARGTLVFERNCMNCHKVGDRGKAVGPDLSATQFGEPEAMLTHILDPNRYVAPNYVQYVVSDKGGRVYTGMIASETASSLTLRRAEGVEDTILRQQVEEIVSTGKSLMPEDFATKLSHQEAADLLAFVLKGRTVRPADERLDVGTLPGLIEPER